MGARVGDLSRLAGRWPSSVTALILVAVGAIGTQLAREDSYFCMELQLFEAGINRWYSPSSEPIPLPQALRLSPLIAAAPAVLGGVPQFLLRDAARGRASALELEQLIRAAPGRVLYSLELGRHVVLACWVAALWLIWLQVRPYGPGPALASVAFCAFTPSFLSFGHLLSSDTLAAAAAVASCASMAWYIEQPKTVRAAVAGGIMGTAIAVKLSLLPLLPAWIVVLYAAAHRARDQQYLPARLILHSAACLFVAWLILAVIHRFSFGPHGWFHSNTFFRLVNGEGTLARFVRTAFWLAPTEVLYGADVQFFYHDFYRSPVRVLGILFQSGTPLYYVGTALFKEPVGFVLLLFVTALGAIRLVIWPFTPEARRVVPFAAFSLLLWVIATGAPGYQDYRYVLPGLVCLGPCLGYLLSAARKPIRFLLYAAVVAGSVEGLLAWPHYTAFVNIAADYFAGDGRRLVDPKTVYRTQDLFRLKEWLDAHPEVSDPILLVRTSGAPLELYGLPDRSGRRRRDQQQEGREAAGATELLLPVRPGWYVVDADQVRDNFVWLRPLEDPPGTPYLYQYLKRARPVAEVGKTILVYRLTREDCEELLRTLGYPPRASGPALQ